MATTLSFLTEPTGVDTIGRPRYGPLASLQAGNKTLSVLRYPLDLGSDYKKHYVQFIAKKITPTYFNGNSPPASTAGAVIAEQTRRGTEDAAKFNTKMNSPGDNFRFDQGAQAEAYINLYIPDTMNFQYNVAYGEISLVEAVNSIPIVGSVTGAATSILQNKAARLLMSSQGLVLNPNQQVLFEGIDFRTFQMAFTFTPVSQNENSMVQDIIKTFRKCAAPTINKNAAGMFFIPPSVFDIEFFYNNSLNPNIPKVKTSVIKDLDVNYAPNGWAAHEGGAPVQTTLTMTFQEISLLDRADIESDGY